MLLIQWPGIGEVNGPPYLCYKHYEKEFGVDYMDSKEKGQESERTVKYYKFYILAYFYSFCLLEFNGIHPHILSNKHIMVSRNK